ncbi:MAG: hypothetical protein Q4C60_09530 [Eubacteriales bacterium]|nr:hypothetical protein [Eubacteriales bacterium]
MDKKEEVIEKIIEKLLEAGLALKETRSVIWEVDKRIRNARVEEIKKTENSAITDLLARGEERSAGGASSKTVMIGETLRHFGVQDLNGMEIGECGNTPFFLEKTGIQFLLNRLPVGKQNTKKARIIIDYDADFPKILVRTTVL